MEGALLGADPLPENHGLVERQSCRSKAQPSSPARQGKRLIPSCNACSCSITATAPKETCPITIKYVTYSELLPAQGHAYSYIQVTQIPSSSRLVFSAQPFTKCSSDTAHSILHHLMVFLPSHLFSFYCSPPSFLPSLSPVPVPGQAWLMCSKGCTCDINEVFPGFRAQSASVPCCCINFSPHWASLLKPGFIYYSLPFSFYHHVLTHNETCRVKLSR